MWMEVQTSYIYIIIYQWLDFFRLFLNILSKDQTFNASSASAGEERFKKYLKKSVKANLCEAEVAVCIGDCTGSKLRTMSKAPKPQGLFRGEFTLQAQFPCLRWPDQIIPNTVISKQHWKSEFFPKRFTCGLKWDRDEIFKPQSDTLTPILHMSV